MKQPLWQRARFIPLDGPLPAGVDFWVQGPARLMPMRTRVGDKVRKLHVPAYPTNYRMRRRGGARVNVRASCVELGGEPGDFADYVDMVPLPVEARDHCEGSRLVASDGPMAAMVAVALDEAPPLLVVPVFTAELGVDFYETMTFIKERLFAHALWLADGKTRQAAKILRMNRTTLRYYVVDKRRRQVKNDSVPPVLSL